MVNDPLEATVPQEESVYQVTVPVELEAAVNACPPAGALSGLPKLSWRWTVITPAAPEHAPAVKVRAGVVNASRLIGAASMENATLLAPVRPGDDAERR